MVNAWVRSIAPPSSRVSAEAATGEPDSTMQAPSQPRPSVLHALSVKIEPSSVGTSACAPGLHQAEGGDEQAQPEHEVDDAEREGDALDLGDLDVLVGELDDRRCAPWPGEKRVPRGESTIALIDPIGPMKNPQPAEVSSGGGGHAGWAADPAPAGAVCERRETVEHALHQMGA